MKRGRLKGKVGISRLKWDYKGIIKIRKKINLSWQMCTENDAEECREGEWEQEEMGAEGGEKAERSHYLKLCHRNCLSSLERPFIRWDKVVKGKVQTNVSHQHHQQQHLESYTVRYIPSKVSMTPNDLWSRGFPLAKPCVWNTDEDRGRSTGGQWVEG